jgi:hypothetical protein
MSMSDLDTRLHQPQASSEVMMSTERTPDRTTHGQAELRIGDAERERAGVLLREHVGAGRLDLAEFETRIGQVYAARTRGELDAVLADLPPAARQAPVTSRTTAAEPARRPSAAVWGPWVLVSAICVVVWVATSLGSGRPLYFWPIWVAGPWGVMLLLGNVTGRPTCGRRAIGR